MIDLHLHTTASDGRLAPAELVGRAAAAGITILSVSDHDTTGGLGEALTAARAAGVRFVHGIEITAVESGRDVHVLGYFIDPSSGDLADFLRTQRGNRVRRFTQMGERLAELGYPIDVAAVIEAAQRHPGRSVGRPQLADALVSSGHAISRSDAFDRLLGAGCPAFVPRAGALVADVTEIIHAAGGVASLAHPGLLGMDEAIPRFASEGLDAIEVRHAEHDAVAEAHYRVLAAQLGLAVSGGSDFHEDAPDHGAALGTVTLPESDFALLELRARSARVSPPQR